jgi:protoporphyrinogen oxidase
MMNENKKLAVVIGAGPAGLAAAYELLERTPYQPLVIEMDTQVGGLSKTLVHGKQRIDIGGHRFFTKNKRVQDWWSRVQVELKWRHRLSRILYLGRFFDYPVSLSLRTLKNLGLIRCVRILMSYAVRPRRPEDQIKNLEDFFISRFGKELYLTFFRDYTQKVWGVPCHQILPTWGGQRIKGLSIIEVLLDATSKLIKLGRQSQETSLIERFQYPDLGPGQLWESVADSIVSRGGIIHLESSIIQIECNEAGAITSVKYRDRFGADHTLKCALVISSMPVRDLICALNPKESQVRDISDGLVYRDFVTVGLLIPKQGSELIHEIKDNWVYVQEPQVEVGRLQFYQNWSSNMNQDPLTTWVGLEYFCQEGDERWNRSEAEWIGVATTELLQIKLIKSDTKILKAVVHKIPKAYPAYFGSYKQFKIIQNYTDRIPNLYLVGRNGQHRYNNSDHSVLTALVAIDLITQGKGPTDLLWRVNTESDYHESK